MTNWICNCEYPNIDLKPVTLKACPSCGMKNGDKRKFPAIKPKEKRIGKIIARVHQAKERSKKCDLCNKKHVMSGSLCHRIITHFGYFDGKSWQITEAGLTQYKKHAK